MSKYPILLIACCSLVSHVAASCEGNARSYTAKVLKEKVLCVSNGGCVQEITARYAERTLVITNGEKPWVEKGEMVEILKLEGVYFPNRTAGSGQSYFYKLARYCEGS